MNSRTRTALAALLAGACCTAAIVTQSTSAGAIGPTISVGDVTVIEGDSGSTKISVPIDLSTTATATATVRYAITGSSATAGTDFQSKSGTVTFAAGTSSKLITAVIYPDTATESDELFNIGLSLPTGATIADGSADVVIVDDDVDGVSSVPEANIGTIEITEADGGIHTARIPVTLSKPATEKTVVRFAATCSTATLGSDSRCRRAAT